MAIDRQALLAWKIPDVEQTFTARDTILYALAIGLGSDPLDEAELPFVHEEALRALPTMAVVLGYPGFWLRDPAIGADWARLLHGEQGLALHRPLPVAGTIVSHTRVVDVFDRGPDKGLVVLSRRDLIDKADGQPLCTLTITSILRGDGGGGGPTAPAVPVARPRAIPDRTPDAVCALPTLPRAALLYRLLGDFNPLHADPKVARASGYPRPILHGLCTYGIACHAIARSVLGYRVERLRSIDARFTAPVFPGETIETRMWLEDETVLFTAWAVERSVMVLGNGVARLSP